MGPYTPIWQLCKPGAGWLRLAKSLISLREARSGLKMGLVAR